MAPTVSTAQLVQGVLAGDRRSLAQAITLIESTLAADQERAAELIAAIGPHTGNSYRLGITGAPGVGKSTFIEALGAQLLAQGLKVAVLSIDPSGVHSGGSILGDKVRMAKLAISEHAFIRPSPAGSAQGGVAASTAEAVLLCEAAGYHVVMVETVGVGQQERRVRTVVDFLLLLVNPGGGDEIQGLKRGLLEVVDAVAVNKADGDQSGLAEQTRGEYEAALHSIKGVQVPVVYAVSALTGHDIAAVWQAVKSQRTALERDGELLQRRSEQCAVLFQDLLQAGLVQKFTTQPAVARQQEALLERLRGNRITPRQAAQELLALFKI